MIDSTPDQAIRHICIAAVCIWFTCTTGLAQEQSSAIMIGDTSVAQIGEATLRGAIFDSRRDPVGGAIIAFDSTSHRTVSEPDGTFALSVPAGDYTLRISVLGFVDLVRPLRIFTSGEQAFALQDESIRLAEVTVSETRANDNITSVLGGVTEMSVEQLERQSKFLGETDVLRSLQSQTGVSSAGEGSSGFNVRGGNADENLILLDGIMIFNPTHTLGFFSLFHPDMVSGVTLYKGGVPAKYGGRLSSVLDVRLREGSYDRFAVNGGVGIASSRFAVEGPIVKQKASFVVGGRMSYFDWMLRRTSNLDLRKSEGFFYDLTAKADARLTSTTKIGFTAIATDDDFQFSDEVKFDYQTRSGSVYIKQLIGEKINLTAQINRGQYTSNLFDINGNDQSRFTYEIGYTRGGVLAFAQPVPSIQMELGAEFTRYDVAPGVLTPLGNSILNPDQLTKEHGDELSFFWHNQWSISPRLELMAGIRYTQFRNLGPDRVYLYEQDLPRDDATIRDSLQFTDGETVARYTGWEPRLALRVVLNDNSSVKLGYNRSLQFLSQISNTASATPIDIWQLSNYHLEPQRADNFSIGYYRNWRQNAIESYATLFYRKINQLIDYKDFARLLLNETIETELVNGTGRAYGLELNINKHVGRHQLELNYTYSRSLRRIIASPEQEGVNGGAWYPTNYDKPHNLNLNYLFQITPKSAFSVNFTYSTGRPATAPVSSFSNSNILTIPIYSDRNAYRIPSYHRLDVAYTIGPWGKSERWLNSLTLSVYNLYFRKNAFSVFFRQNPFQRVTAYRVAVLGTMFPAITYNFKFK